MNLVFRRPGQALVTIASLMAAAFLIIGCTIFTATSASAHQLRPALAEVIFADDGTSYEIVIQSNLEALIAGVGPDHEDTDDSPYAAHYSNLRSMSSAELGAAFSDYSAAFLRSIAIFAGEGRLSPVISGVQIPPTGDVSLARDSFVSISGELPAGTGGNYLCMGCQQRPHCDPHCCE